MFDSFNNAFFAEWFFCPEESADSFAFLEFGAYCAGGEI